jgi:hypothetical protein
VQHDLDSWQDGGEIVIGGDGGMKRGEGIVILAKRFAARDETVA